MKHVFLIESKKLVCNEAQLFTPESVSACLGIWKARFVRESREWWNLESKICERIPGMVLGIERLSCTLQFNFVETNVCR
jgi:hypothetical protein